MAARMKTASPSRRSPAADLDNPSSWQKLDPKGMLDFAVDFPAQVADAAEIGAAFVPPASLREPANIVLAGMGGSAVGGDFLIRLCEHRIPVPFVVSRDYEIPRFVGPDTLFIASSHSGNTEETLEATQRAYRRKARIMCITTNGELAKFARRRKLPLLTIPLGDPPMPPRASLGYSFIPLVSVLGKLGLYPGARSQIRETISLLTGIQKRIAPGIPERRNPAKRMARSLFGKLPWVQGTAGIMSAAAYRWRCQFNENSKVLAYASEYPELNHNEVVGWEVPAEMAQGIEVVILCRPEDYYRVRARVEITRRMIAEKTRVHLLLAEGKSPLAQLMSTVYLGDFISLYLAFLNGVDPSTIGPINVLKSRLARLKPPSGG